MTRTKNEDSKERLRWAAREIAAGAAPAIVARLCGLSQAVLEHPHEGDPEFAELVDAYRTSYEGIAIDARLRALSERALRAAEHRLEAGELTGVGPLLKELRLQLAPAPERTPETAEALSERRSNAFMATLAPEQRAYFGQRSWEAMRDLDDLDADEPGGDADGTADDPGEAGRFS